MELSSFFFCLFYKKWVIRVCWKPETVFGHEPICFRIGETKREMEWGRERKLEEREKREGEREREPISVCVWRCGIVKSFMKAESNQNYHEDKNNKTKQNIIIIIIII